MIWDDFRYFLTLARTGSLSATARQLGVNQSTVGRRIAALQTASGTRLFDRTPHGYAPTAAADAILTDVSSLEEGFLTVQRRLAGRDAKPEGSVRLATTDTLALAFLVDHLPAFRAQHPGLVLELITSNQPVDLARREADLALRLGALPKQPNLVVRSLGTASFGLFGSPRYLSRRGRPKLRDRLRGHDIVGYRGALETAPLGRWVDEHASQATVVLRADNIEVVWAAVASGLGLGVLPSIYGQRGLERIGSNAGATPVFTIVHEDLARSARVRAVLEFLAELVHRERPAFAGS